MDYYNTNSEHGQVLAKSNEKALAQEEIILCYFRKNPEHIFSPDDIHGILFSERVPITSVRRSMTNLTTKGYLDKTDQQKIGSYGKMTYCWKLKQIVVAEPFKETLF